MSKVKTIRELFERYVLKNQNRTVFAHKKGYRTYVLTGKEFQINVNKITSLLRKNNFKKGDKIILLSSDYLNWISVYFAAVMDGIIVVPLDILTDVTFLERIQKQVEAKAIFQDKGLVEINIKTFYFQDLEESLKEIELTEISKIEIFPDDILEIMYTSGTTGEPKGVVLTNKNVLAGLESLIKAVFLLRFKMLNLLPLSHIFGQIAGLFLYMYYNNTIYFLDTIQPRKVIDFIRLKRINGTIITPGILKALKDELDGKFVTNELGWQFQIIGVGGASLDLELEKWWKKRVLAVIQGYGLTETCSVLSSNKILKTKTGSVGLILSGIERKIASDGEILVKGENVFSGYYKDEEKTMEVFENGWFKTGDIGVLKNNRLFIKDRKKDIIVLSVGLKVYPIDVENIINLNEAVIDSCVIEKEGKVHAVLILKEQNDISDIIFNVNKKLLSHQKISSYSIWPEDNFPKTFTGKIKKFLVKEKLKEEREQKHNYTDLISQIINNILNPRNKFTDNSKLVELGMDSLKRVELISEIEKKFNIEIDEIKLNQETTISDLGKMLKNEKINRIKFRKWPIFTISKIVRVIIQNISFYTVGRFFTKTKYHGLENIKNITSPVIFASNHQSSWEGPCIIQKINTKVAVAASSDVVYGIGVKGILNIIKKKMIGFYCSIAYNTYPLGPEIGIGTSMDFTGEMIDRGYSILIFPEGARTLDGEIHEFMSGIGYMVANMKLPVVPIKVDGFFHILPAGKSIPRFGPSSIKFGKPIYFKNETYLEATKVIEEEIKKL